MILVRLLTHSASKGWNELALEITAEDDAGCALRNHLRRRDTDLAAARVAYQSYPRRSTSFVGSLPASEAIAEGFGTGSQFGICLHRFKNCLGKFTSEALRCRAHHGRDFII